MIRTRPANLPNGLRLPELAASCASLFGRVRLGFRCRGGPYRSETRVRTRITCATGTKNYGWLAVADHAATLALVGTGHYRVPDLAAELRKAYARGLGTAGTELPWERVPPLTRLAWEAVARLVADATQASAREVAGGLRAAEDHRANFAERQLLERGISRE